MTIQALVLLTALPELREAEANLRHYADVNGITYEFADFGGVRNEADTLLILKYREDDYALAKSANPNLPPIEEWRPIQPFGSSFHNFGAAFDLTNVKPAGALTRLKTKAPEFGLRSSVPNDPGHFQLAITLDEARRRWASYHPQNMAALAGVAIAIAALILPLLAPRKK